MTALVDTGVLLAAVALGDQQHDIAVLALEEEEEVLLPDVVLPELAYLVLRDMDYATLALFLQSIVDGELPLVVVTADDIARATAVMLQYASARVDFVDCVIVAMAERLNIKRILTLDRRHFSLFRPRHCSAFELIP